MTLPSDTQDQQPEPLFLWEEEKKTTRDNLFADIDSADPPLWAGSPLPKKAPWYRRLWSYITGLLF